MKIFLIILIHLFFIQNILSQCDCEKIYRGDGAVTQCKPAPIGGDRTMQFGMSLASNGDNRFVTLTIRFISSQSLSIKGDLNIRLSDNNMVTLNLVNTQSSYIGNSPVENAIFLINEVQFNKLKAANLLTISINLSDNRIHTIEATLNKDVLKVQSKCL